jgi:phosphoribosylformylglycinamidine (FGAM) synthase PurS component
MGTIKLFVGLKIPDTTAITTLHALERMGYSEIEALEREDFYEFVVDDDVEKFMKNIVKTDILVNANKNYFRILSQQEKDEKKELLNTIACKVVVTNSDDDFAGLLSTLRDRMGFKELQSIKRSVLWKLHFKVKTDVQARQLAEKITKELLYNENYQDYLIL